MDSDVRFDVIRNPEPDFVDSQYRVDVYGIPSGELLETHFVADPGSMIEAWREAQMFDAEGMDQQERMDYYEAKDAYNAPF